MRISFARRLLLAWVALLAVVFLVSETQSQQRRRTSRRVTNPVRPAAAIPIPSPLPTPVGTPPARTRNPSDPQLISTADEQEGTPARRTGTRTRRNEPATETENEVLRRTVTDLSSQVTKLAEDLGTIKEQQRTMVDLDRLSRAEQRAEGFRSQLRDVVERESDLQGRMEQLDLELLPENIQRRAALTGTFRPEELRDQIRRQLEGEKRRVQAQLDLLATSRTRLEAAIAGADAEVERLRARVEASDRQEGATGTRATSTAAPTPTPTPAATPTTEGEPPEQLQR